MTYSRSQLWQDWLADIRSSDRYDTYLADEAELVTLANYLNIKWEAA